MKGGSQGGRSPPCCLNLREALKAKFRFVSVDYPQCLGDCGVDDLFLYFGKDLSTLSSVEESVGDF